MFFDFSPDNYPHVFSGFQWFAFMLLLHESKLKNVAVCLRRDSAGKNSSTPLPPPKFAFFFVCMFFSCFFVAQWQIFLGEHS